MSTPSIHARRSSAATVQALKATVGITLLAALLGFQLVSQVVSPGFTDNWGFLVTQTGGTLALVCVAELLFRRQGGLSWQAHTLVVIACYADHIGNDRYWYYAFAGYDKFTHCLGIAAITACAGDCLAARSQPGFRSRPSTHHLRDAVAIGLAVGVGWEYFELLGDALVRSARVHGWRDSAVDLIFDSLGALLAVTLPVVVRHLRERVKLKALKQSRPPWSFQRAIGAASAVIPHGPRFWAGIGAAVALLLLLERAPLTSLPIVAALTLAAGIRRPPPSAQLLLAA